MKLPNWLRASKRVMGFTRPTRPISTQRLCVQLLEDRTVPAITAVNNGGVLTVSLSADDSVTVGGVDNSGSNVGVVASNFPQQSFSGVTSVVVQDTSGGTATNQSVAFADAGGTSNIHLTGTLNVTGIETIALNNPVNPLTVDGNVAFAGASVINTSNTLLQLSSGATISMQAAGSGDAIGTSANPIKFKAAGLVADTSAGNGNQFLSVNGAVSVGNASLNAATGTISLTAGKLLMNGSNVINDQTNLNIAAGATMDMNPPSGETIGGLSGSGSITTSLTGLAVLTVGANNASSSFDGTITDGTGQLALVKTGTGSFTVTNAGSTYTGGTTISNGTLAYTAGSALGKGDITLGDANTPAGADPMLLAASTSNTTLSNNILVLDDGARIGSVNDPVNNPTVNFTGTITNNGNQLFLQGGTGDRTTFSGQITGTGYLNITSTAPGRRVVLDNGTANPNDFAGGLVFINNDATLQLGVFSKAEQLPDSADIHFSNAGSTLSIFQVNESAGALVSDNPGAGTIQSFGGSPVLTFGVNNADGDYSGNIIDNGGTLSLVMGGTGYQLFDGSSTIPGTTTVGGGGAIGGTNGSFTGPVVVQANASLLPGTTSTTSTLTTGNVTFQTGSALGIQILSPSSFDVLNVVGSVTIQSGAVLFIVESGTVPAAGTTITIISNATSLSGTFVDTANNPIPEGGDVTASDGTLYTLSYVGGSGHDVTLTAPLPGLLAVGNVGGTVRLFEADNGAQITNVRPLDNGPVQYTGGVSVALADFNGDGTADLAVSAVDPVGTNGLSSSKAGKVFIFDGVDLAKGTLTLTKTLTPFATSSSGGAYTNGLNIAAGDVDGDGDIDIVVGSRGQIGGTSGPVGKVEQGRLVVINVADGSTVGSIITPFGAGYQKGVVVAAGNLDSAVGDEIAVTRGGPVASSLPANIQTIKLKAFKFAGAGLTELDLAGNGGTSALAPFAPLDIRRDGRIAIVDSDGDGKNGTLVFTALDRTTSNTQVRVAAFSVNATSGVATAVSTGTGPSSSYVTGNNIGDHSITTVAPNGGNLHYLTLVTESNTSQVQYLDPLNGSTAVPGFFLFLLNGGVNINGF